MFRQLIWELLLSIPYGETTTCGTQGKTAANPVAIIIPCHRVVGADGSMPGYAGGLHDKKALLELETPEL